MAVDGPGGGDGRSGRKPADESLIDNFELRKDSTEGKPRRPEEASDSLHEDLAIEKQVANPNIHYGSQDEPESFVTAPEGESDSEPLTDGAETEVTPTDDRESREDEAQADSGDPAKPEPQGDETGAVSERPSARTHGRSDSAHVYLLATVSGRLRTPQDSLGLPVGRPGSTRPARRT